MHSLIIVEDHPVMRRGLEMYFAGTGRRQILGSVPDIEEARNLLSRPDLAADILLLDIRLESGWGLDLLPWLRSHFEARSQFRAGERGPEAREGPGQAPPVVIYSAFTGCAYVNAAFGMGVRGYVCKTRSEAELEAALEAVLRGEIYRDEAAERELAAVIDAVSLLTRREGEILILVKKGLSNTAIANRLGLSRRTVETILSCVYDKTGVSSRLELQKL
jgi:NarL family two-component system response regulator LiaR